MAEVIVLPGDGVLGQVDQAKLIRIRIKLDIEHGDCRFEVNDLGEYVVRIEDTVIQLTTAVCKNPQYLSQLLVAGGSVMAVCYALYKLGYLAVNFSTGCLEFDLKVEPAKLATIRRQITKGRFVESLQDEVDAIIEEHTTALAHLKNFTIQSAKEKTVKPSDVNFKADRSIRITNEISCNPEWTCNLELHQGKYFVVVNGQRVELKTKIWPLEKGLKQLLAYGGAPVLLCYGLYKLGYDAFEFSREGARFKIKTSDSSQIKKIQRFLMSGSFAYKLNAEISEIIFEHRDELGHVNFKITSCSEVQEPSSNMSVVSESTLPKLPSGPSTEVVDKPKLVADALSTGNQPTNQDSPTQDPDPIRVPKSTPSSDKNYPPQSTTQADSVPTNPPDEDQKNPIKYDIGIFAHEHDMEKAARIKGHCDSLGYNTCIFDDWVGAGGEPLPRKVLSFIKECLVLFWIAPPQRHSGSYMEHWKNVALHNAIESNNSPFVVVIPMEYKKKDIVPPELKAYDPITEDNKIRIRIKATVKAAQALTPNPPAANDSQNIPTTSGPLTDVPGPSITSITNITNIIHIYDSSVGSLLLQGQGVYDSKPKEK